MCGISIGYNIQKCGICAHYNQRVILEAGSTKGLVTYIILQMHITIATLHDDNRKSYINTY